MKELLFALFLSVTKDHHMSQLCPLLSLQSVSISVLRYKVRVRFERKYANPVLARYTVCRVQCELYIEEYKIDLPSVQYIVYSTLKISETFGAPLPLFLEIRISECEGGKF